MKIVSISVTNMLPIAVEYDVLKFVGQVAGECYNSSMDDEKCVKRALGCITRGHHSPFEHANITLKCTVDRGVSHALVRHRHCAFQQSSTIYQKFNELVFIDTGVSIPVLSSIEEEYKYQVTEHKMKAAEARDILPNCLATNLIITTNIRQWMYMIHRRCGPGDSNNMHEWCRLTREWFEKHYPQITQTFDAWYERHPL